MKTSVTDHQHFKNVCGSGFLFNTDPDPDSNFVILLVQKKDQIFIQSFPNFCMACLRNKNAIFQQNKKTLYNDINSLLSRL